MLFSALSLHVTNGTKVCYSVLSHFMLLTLLKYAIQCSVPKGMTSAVSMMSISEQPDQPLAALLQDTIILYEDFERELDLKVRKFRKICT